MLQKTSEKELIKRCLSGDQTAWDELYKRYYNLIKSVVVNPKWGFDFSHAEDLVHDIFIEIVKALKSFDYKCKLSTFIVRISQNKCVSILRAALAQKRIKNELLISLEEKKSAEEEGFIQMPSGNPGPQEEILKAEEKDKVRRALKKLKKECQKVLFLRFFADKSYREIAAELSLPLGTVCIQIKRCLESLKKFYVSFND
ncbi:MAG: RNA polymerase sigma factor [Armatimonadota bacterium]